ncbi:metallophosphoesterase family protein [Corynebacterium minutissimum]
MASILIFADLHLGRPGAPRMEWALNVLETTDADACICLGDIIDRKADAATYVPQAQQVMARAGELFDDAHFISGNHDVHHKLSFPSSVTVHPTEVHSFHCAGAIIVTAAVAADPDPRMLTFPARQGDGPHLGLLHSSVTGEFSKSVCLPATPEDLQSCGYDAWILGHVHKPRVLAKAPFIGWVGMGNAVLYDVPSASLTYL